MTLEVCFQSYDGIDIDRQGNVHRTHWERNGTAETRTEHISESPIVDVLPGWLWDLALDPRADA